MRYIKKRYALLFSGLALACSASILKAQEAFPNKPIRIIVPFAAGGSTDILARMTGETISKALKQPVIIENKAGASGNIGMEAIAKAAPDGYSLLFTSTNLTLNPAVYKKTPFDPIKDFAGITMVAFAPMLLITRPDFGGDSIKSLVKFGLEHPGKLNFSSSGAGGTPHLAGEMLQIATGIKMTHVPYGGAAPAITDIVAGQVEMTFTTYISAQAMLSSGRLRALAVASNERLAALPNVPTFAQEGYQNMEFGTMFGLLAPAGTPRPIIEQIYQTIKDASKQPAFNEKIVEQGGYMVVNTPLDYDKYLEEDVSKWVKLIKDIGGVTMN
jgi:tripartite-type tricarboxylate transporter receptor subunit TctC